MKEDDYTESADRNELNITLYKRKPQYFGLIRAGKPNPEHP